MKIKYIRLAATLFIFAMLTIPATVQAGEIESIETQTSESPKISFDAGDEVYINEFTFFYKEAKEADYYGNIKAGERVQIENIENGYAKISYAGEEGYINTSFLSNEIPTRTFQNDNGQTETAYIPFVEEKIIPANHFFTQLDSTANEAIELWLTDEYDDDYIYITDGTSAYLDYFAWQRIGWMGLNEFTIIYQKDGINLFRIVIPAQEGIDPEKIDYSNIQSLNLEFSYDDGMLDFPNEIGTDIRLEFYDSTVENVETNSKPLEGNTGYTCFSTAGNSTYAISEKDLLQVVTEDSTESVLGNSSKKRSTKLTVFRILGILLLVTAAVFGGRLLMVKNARKKRKK